MKADKKTPFYTKLAPDLREAMRRYKEVVGVPEAQQIDRALRKWLAERADAWPVPVSKPPARGTTRGKKR
jgi:hypothetical protein